MIYHCRLFCCNSSAAACRDNLVPVKTVCSEVSDCSGISPCIPALCISGAQSFCGILDNFQIVSFCDFHNGFHIRHIAEYMNNDDCFNMPPMIHQGFTVILTLCFTELFQFGRIHAKAVITVYKHRCCKLIFYRINRSNKGQWRYDHYIARLDSGLNQREVQCRSAALACRHIFNIQKCCKLFFKLSYISASGRYPALFKCIVYVFFFVPFKIRY